jgi:hypothetical protein
MSDENKEPRIEEQAMRYAAIFSEILNEPKYDNEIRGDFIGSRHRMNSMPEIPNVFKHVIPH